MENHKIESAIKSLMDFCVFLESLKTKPKSLENTNKFRRLISKDSWTKAVPDHLLLNYDSDRERSRYAHLILDQILEKQINGKKFLDFGCGFGDLVYESFDQKTSLSVGYDVKSFGWNRFPKNNQLIFTNNIEVVKENKYDCIFLYNILNYSIDPLSMIEMTYNLLENKGLVYIRVIPWSSRYGMSDIRKLNKAFAHLYLEEHELETYGQKVSPMKVIHYETYEEWFKGLGFKIRTRKINRIPIEGIFKTPLMSQKLIDLYSKSRLPEEHLEIAHIDYVLGKT